MGEVCGPNKTKEISTHPHKMSEAQVKNDVVAEAPSAEELKNLKRAAEDDEVDSKKQKTNGANHEDAEDEENGEGEDEEDLDGEEEEDLEGEGEDVEEDEEEGEGLFWAPGHFYTYPKDEEGEDEEGEGDEDEG